MSKAYGCIFVMREYVASIVLTLLSSPIVSFNILPFTKRKPPVTTY